MNAVSSVTGTASDAGAAASGVGGTQIQIQRNSDLDCWNGAAVGGDCATDPTTWLGAVAGANWAVTSGLPPMNNLNTGFQNGSAYTLTSRAFDVAANTQTVLTSNFFTVDLTSPTGGRSRSPPTARTSTAVPQIAGTAQDAAPGLLAPPQVSIEDIPNGTYWNGAGNFGARTSTWRRRRSLRSRRPTARSCTWHYNTAAIPWGDGAGRYLVEVQVIDAAGNFTITSSTFSFDHTAPLSNLTYPPSSGLFFSSMTAILGTAEDLTSPIPTVSAHMWYVSAGTTYYFTPATPHWSTTDGGPIVIGGAGTAAGGVTSPWSFNSTQISDFNTPGTANYVWHNGTNDGADGHKFNIVSIAVDAATNVQTVLSTVSFTFDNVPPTSTATAPINGSAYTSRAPGPTANSLPTLSGTANDDVSGVGSVVLAIEDMNGDGRPAVVRRLRQPSPPTPVPLNVLPSNLFVSSWTYSSGFLSFTTQNHYIVYSTATDNVGNVENVVGQSEFLFDTDPPVSGVQAAGEPDHLHKPADFGRHVVGSELRQSGRMPHHRLVRRLGRVSRRRPDLAEGAGRGRDLRGHDRVPERRDHLPAAGRPRRRAATSGTARRGCRRTSAGRRCWGAGRRTPAGRPRPLVLWRDGQRQPRLHGEQHVLEPRQRLRDVVARDGQRGQPTGRVRTAIRN